MTRAPALAIGTFLAVAACGGTAPPPETPAEPELPPLPSLPLLVPDGAEVVVVARPARLAASTAFRTVVDAAVAPELLDSFARRTGVEPLEVEEAVVAEYENGFLLLARGPWPARDVVRAAQMRMNTVEASQERPFFRRRGYLGADLRDLVALDEHVVLVAGGAPGPVASLLARAERGGWGSGASAALAAEEVAELWEAGRDAPLVLFAPEPLELPPGYPTSVLLAQQRALSATLRAEDAATLAVEVDLRGEFPEGAEDKFRALVDSVAASGLGAALGIAEASETLRIQTEPGSAVLRMRLPAESLATGLRVLFVADLEELLEGPIDHP